MSTTSTLTSLPDPSLHSIPSATPLVASPTVSSVSSSHLSPPSLSPWPISQMSNHRRPTSEQSSATPAFADLFCRDPSAPPPVLPPEPPVEKREITKLFRQRRLRAHKLSRFFGVTLQDFSHTNKCQMELVRTVKPSSLSMDIELKMNEPNRLWTFGDGGQRALREVDMPDVIEKLRHMRI